jgi:hypothetical protein
VAMTRKSHSPDPIRAFDSYPQRRILWGYGYGLRRLYSTFAGSWPGAGLLLLRLVVGAIILVDAGSKLWSDPPLLTTLTSASLAVSGLLLVGGLWTPLAGTAVAVLDISQVLATARCWARVAGQWTPSSSDGSASKRHGAVIVRTCSEYRSSTRLKPPGEQAHRGQSSSCRVEARRRHPKGWRARPTK